MGLKWFFFQSLGGLGLFIFGMKIMSEGLQRIAGKKMRQILGFVSNNRVVGCTVGALVTSVIQSSSATTVMLVSFVDAGLMSLRQAIGVILGANVGTTVTAQLIAFNITRYALPAIALGVALKFFIGRRKWIYMGDVLLGFGLVFFGLATMKSGFAPLKDHELFISFFTKFSAASMPGIIMCVFAGTILTMILQSSSATVGITMALASQGLIDFSASVALILGENIGTTITAQLAALGANLNARRTANAHTLFNVFGVCLMILFFPLFIKLVMFSTSSLLHTGPPDIIVSGEKPNILRYIANSHTLFNVVNAIFFLAILPFLIRVTIWLSPKPKKEDRLADLHHVNYIDYKFINTSPVALTQARAEIERMAEVVLLMYDDVIMSIKQRRFKQLSKWKKREEDIDNLQREIIAFLVKVMQGSITPDESKEVASLMRMTNNLERAGDAIENIAYLGEELIGQDLHFSEGGSRDFDTISNEVRKFLCLVRDSIGEDAGDILAVGEKFENNIDLMREEMKGNNIVRLQSATCTVDPGLIFVDMLSAFEKIGDFCFNVAQAIAGVK